MEPEKSNIGPVQERVMKIVEDAIKDGKEVPEKMLAILMDLMNKEIEERRAMSAASVNSHVQQQLELGLGYPSVSMPDCVVSEINAGNGDMFASRDMEIQHHLGNESPTLLPVIPGISDAIKAHYEAAITLAREKFDKNEDNEDALASNGRWPRLRHRQHFSYMYDMRANAGDAVSLDVSKFPQKFVEYIDACVPRKNWANAIINHCEFEARQHHALTQKLIVQSICDHFKLAPPTPEDLGESQYPLAINSPFGCSPFGFNSQGGQFVPLDEDAIGELFPNGPPTGFQG